MIQIEQKWKWENAELLANGVKVAFLGIQNGKTQRFLKMAASIFVHVFISTYVFLYVIFAFLIQKLSGKILKMEANW